LRGRVMGLWMLLFAGSTPFGGYLTGFLAEEVGVREAIGFNAAMCAIGLAVALVYYFTHREQVEAKSLVVGSSA
jgi:MFS family permease